MPLSAFAEVVAVLEVVWVRFFNDEATGRVEVAWVVRVHFFFPFDNEVTFGSGLDDSRRFDGCKDNEISESGKVLYE